MKLQQVLFRAYVLVTFFMGFVISIFPIAAFNLVDDIVFIFMAVNMLAIVRRKRLRINVIFVVFCSFILLSAFYALLNENSPAAVLMSLRQYKNFFLCLLIPTIDRSQIEFVKKVLFVSLVLSIPLSIFQYIYADRSNTAYFDEVVGIFGYGQSGTLSLLILLYVMFTLYIRIREGQSVFGWYLILLLPCFINETKIVFILLPALFLALLIMSVWNTSPDERKKWSSGLLLFLPLFFMVILIANFSYEFFLEESLYKIFSADKLEKYLFVDEMSPHQDIDIGRFQRVLYAYDYVERQGLITRLFGEGLGASYYGVNSGIFGVVAGYLPPDLSTGSRIQIYHSVIDFGLFGTALLLTFFIAAFFSIARYPYKGEIAYLAGLATVIVLMGLFYQNILTNRIVSFLALYFLYHFHAYKSKQSMERV